MNYILFCLIFISFSIFTGKKSLYKVIFDSEIILTIKGNNTQQILNNSTIKITDSNDILNNYVFNELPSEILVNGNRINTIDFYVYNLTLDENNITIKFNKTLENCNVMFAGLSNITKIYFKKFDFSTTQMIGMFQTCKGLRSLDISNLKTSSVTSMSCLFNGCNNLISLNLGYLDTSSVTDMEYMFSSCFNLTSLDLKNFNTSSATALSFMFNKCISLKSLDLSNFDTSSVTRMISLFRYCISLTSLDLSNFNTSSVKTMSNMFCLSRNLIKLNLSNFDTSSVTDMTSMFEGCKNLISLDLRINESSSIKIMDYMFKDCNNLIFLDLRYFNTVSVINMFDGSNTNLIYCINNYTSNNIISELNNYNFTDNCSDICFDENKKIIYDIKKCVLNCIDDYKFEYKNICYSSCPNGTYNINNICITNNSINNITIDNYTSISSINYNLPSIFNSYFEYFKDIIKINNTLNNKDNIIINIESELIKNNLDIFLENIIIKEYKDLMIKENNIIYQLTQPTIKITMNIIIYLQLI